MYALLVCVFVSVFFFKQKTAYEMRISDWSSTCALPISAHPDISEALVHDLVFAFYDRIRADATLGPIFDGVIGDRWDEHLAKMCDFWSSVMLASGRYE